MCTLFFGNSSIWLVALGQHKCLNFSNLKIAQAWAEFLPKGGVHSGATSHFRSSGPAGGDLAHSTSRLSSNNVELEAIYNRLLNLQKGEWQSVNSLNTLCYRTCSLIGGKLLNRCSLWGAKHRSLLNVVPWADKQNVSRPCLYPLD